MALAGVIASFSVKPSFARYSLWKGPHKPVCMVSVAVVPGSPQIFGTSARFTARSSTPWRPKRSGSTRSSFGCSRRASSCQAAVRPLARFRLGGGGAGRRGMTGNPVQIWGLGCVVFLELAPWKWKSKTKPPQLRWGSPFGDENAQSPFFTLSCGSRHVIRTFMSGSLWLAKQPANKVATLV